LLVLTLLESLAAAAAFSVAPVGVPSPAPSGAAACADRSWRQRGMTAAMATIAAKDREFQIGMLHSAKL